jgi:hypothetical protein
MLLQERCMPCSPLAQPGSIMLMALYDIRQADRPTAGTLHGQQLPVRCITKLLPSRLSSRKSAFITKTKLHFRFCTSYFTGV